MKKEIHNFQSFVNNHVPQGESITDSHIAAQAWGNIFNDSPVSPSDTHHQRDLDSLSIKDFRDKAFFPR